MITQTFLAALVGLSSAAIIQNDTRSGLDVTDTIRPLDFLDTNPTSVRGEKLHEGDILLTEAQRLQLSERKNILSSTRYWPDGPSGFPRVPYRFGDSEVDKDAVRAGIGHWEENTCITFEEYDSRPWETHISFIKDSGCWSYIGHIGSFGTSGQQISIGAGCQGLGIVAHEIGHAMGFYHEQSRIDRDNYIVVNSENIQSGREGNFGKSSTGTEVEYDYKSVMHYSPKSFTSNGLPTLSTKDPLKNYLLGQILELSFRDIKLANLMYDCVDTWMASCGLTTSPCQNEGYIGSDCNCVCPDNTNGDNCENLLSSYYGDEPTDNCTREVTTEGTITSPNYPNNYPAGLQCTIVIKAPECSLPRVTFNTFQLYPGATCFGAPCCYYDSLDIRMLPTEPDNSFCGTEIQQGTSFVGTNSDLTLYFYTRRNSNPGWSANVTFDSISGCSQSTIAPPPATTQPTPAPTPTTTQPTPAPTLATTQPTAASSECLLVSQTNEDIWTSVNYPLNYPNDAECSWVNERTCEGMVTISAKYELEGNYFGCYDYLELEYLYGRTKIVCGTSSNYQEVKKMPSCHFNMNFFSDYSITKKGFSVKVEYETSSTGADCYKTINIDAGNSYTIQTPDYDGTYTARPLFCEYIVQAPAGSQIIVSEVIPNIRAQTGCPNDFVVLNQNGDHLYPRDTSKIICDRTTQQNVLVTDDNVLLVAYQKLSRRSYGFSMKVEVAP